MDMHIKHQTVPVRACTGPKSGEAAWAYLLAAEHQLSQSLRAGGKTLPRGANVDVSSFCSFRSFPFIFFCFKAPDVRPKGRKTGRVRNSSSAGQAQMRHEVEKPNHVGLQGFRGTLAGKKFFAA